MSCTRAQGLDLQAFVTDRSSEAWSSFVAHYPTCIDCSRAVAEPTRLIGALAVLRSDAGSEASSGHPTEADLLAYGAAPDDITHTGVALHVRGCAICSSALSASRDFDFARLAATERPDPQPIPLRPRLAALLRPGPALALAAGLAGFLYLQWPRLPETPTTVASTPLADGAPETHDAAAAPTPAAFAQEAELDAAPEHEEIAAATPARRPTAAGPGQPEAEALEPGTRASSANAGSVVAREEPSEPDHRDAPEAPPTIREEEAVLVAANSPVEAPHYVPDPALAGGSLRPFRMDTAIRGARFDLPTISVLAPLHAGATAHASPTLYWELSAASEVPVELVLADATSIEPLLILEIEAPVAAGVHALDLRAHGRNLRPGVTYRWYASLVPDPAHPETEASSAAAIRFAPPPDAWRAEHESGPTPQRAHREAAAGYWYDAFATVSRWASEAPDEPRFAGYRRALLEQVGLGARN